MGPPLVTDRSPAPGGGHVPARYLTEKASVSSGGDCYRVCQVREDLQNNSYDECEPKGEEIKSAFMKVDNIMDDL